MKSVAIVLAGGTGKRMNSAIPKQYLEINNKPIIYYTLKSFEDSFIDEVILVAKAGDEEYCKREIVDKYKFSKVVSIVTGGKERYNSVMNGLDVISDDCDYVYIHDGARPFVDQEMLNRLNVSLSQNAACIAAMPVKDTIKIVNDKCEVIDTPARSNVYQIQTPQAFHYRLIKTAYSNMNAAMNKPDFNIQITDDAMVVENFTEERVIVVEGSYKNIKITSPDDILIAEKIIDENGLN